jgi:hypothetical protein
MTFTPDVTTMTITSDQNPQATRQAPGGDGGECPGCPARPWTALPRCSWPARPANETCPRGAESGPASRAGPPNPP